MADRIDVLREVMDRTSTTQSELARLSGVRQSSISQMLSGTVNPSDEQLDRLLSCMGYRLEIIRRPVVPELTRAERRSWLLHRRLATRVNAADFQSWKPRIERNLERLRAGVAGEPHLRNLRRWEAMVEQNDLPAIHRALTGLDRPSIELREVSPMGGLLPQDERTDILRQAS